MTEISLPRVLDHLVLPVIDIDVARSRYQSLGFTVAPDGRHPFGTENCCVFFEDSTFLEPLGIAQRETCEARAIAGNTFVANDQTYRFRRGNEGFSHLVIKSDDARADNTSYKAAGMSAGKMVRFSRGYKDSAGNKQKVSFHLAFAGDQRSPDSGFFSCQVTQAPAGGRGALVNHENGVIGIKEVILSEVNPTDFQYFFQMFLNQREMDVDSFGMSFDLAAARITVLSPHGMQAFYGMEAEKKERGMQFAAIILSVKDLTKTTAILRSNKVDCDIQSDKITISPAAGQGTTIIMEEAD